MSKPLPPDRFKPNDADKFYLKKYTDNSPRGCILELYLEYSKRITKFGQRLSFSYWKVIKCKRYVI